MPQPREDVAARFVTTAGVSNILTICAEMMMRHSQRTSSGKQIFVGTAVLNGETSLYFSAATHPRKVWVVPYNGGGYLLWFANISGQVIRCREGNSIPDNLLCHSAIYRMVGGVTRVVEEFILHSKLPESTIPPSHLETLTG